MDTSAATAQAERRDALVPSALIGAAFVVVTVIFALASSWYATFKAVHVVFAAIWIGGGALLTILGTIAEFRDDPLEIAAVARQAAMVGERLFTPSALVVLAMGIAMMINGSLDWGTFWVSFGLLGFASTFVIGLFVLAPLSKRTSAAIEASGAHSPEAQALIRRILLVARIDVAVLLLVIVDMAVKPFA